MKGIACAFEGRLGRDAELKTTHAGRQFLAFSVIVGEDEEAQWLNVSAWSDHLTDLAPSLAKGVEVYVEGKLKMRHWESADGPRSGLQVSASVVQPLALIGRSKPKGPPRGKSARSKVDSQAPLNTAPAFNDSIDDLF
jgi:single-stranded DNA-binding protein